jgi:hypothetical protein
MTQPTQEGAVGDANAIVDAAELPIEDRFAAIADEEGGERPAAAEEEALRSRSADCCPTCSVGSHCQAQVQDIPDLTAVVKMLAR